MGRPVAHMTGAEYQRVSAGGLAGRHRRLRASARLARPRRHRGRRQLRGGQPPRPRHRQHAHGPARRGARPARRRHRPRRRVRQPPRPRRAVRAGGASPRRGVRDQQDAWRREPARPRDRHPHGAHGGPDAGRCAVSRGMERRRGGLGRSRRWAAAGEAGCAAAHRRDPPAVPEQHDRRRRARRRAGRRRALRGFSGRAGGRRGDRAAGHQEHGRRPGVAAGARSRRGGAGRRGRGGSRWSASAAATRCSAAASSTLRTSSPSSDVVDGLGLLDVETTFAGEKRTVRVAGEVLGPQADGPLGAARDAGARLRDPHGPHRARARRGAAASAARRRRARARGWGCVRGRLRHVRARPVRPAGAARRVPEQAPRGARPASAPGLRRRGPTTSTASPTTSRRHLDAAALDALIGA